MQVAMKKFIDDISVLAVERCLINKLPHLFQAESVLDLKDEEVARVAGETAEAAAERDRCSEKLAILEDGRRDLIRLATCGALDEGEVVCLFFFSFFFFCLFPSSRLSPLLSFFPHIFYLSIF